jgi:hypothetical protein
MEPELFSHPQHLYPFLQGILTVSKCLRNRSFSYLIFHIPDVKNVCLLHGPL